MRHRPTDAEARLWFFMRNRSLDGRKFRRQHAVGPYILDFYCPEAKLAVELDGGQHAEDAQLALDAERTAKLETRGIRVLRFWNDVILKDIETVLEIIQRALRDPSPLPLSPKGRGVSVQSPGPAQNPRSRQAEPCNPSPLPSGERVRGEGPFKTSDPTDVCEVSDA